MPHEIDVSTGSAAVLVAGEPPWHGLGTVIQHAAGSQQALQLAHLDWTVESWPLWAGPQNQPRPVTTHVANVRSDTQAVLGVVSRRYRIFQNRAAFAFLCGAPHKKAYVAQVVMWFSRRKRGAGTRYVKCCAT